MEEPPSVSILRMDLGEVRPHESSTQAPIEESNKDQPSSSTRVEPPSSQVSQDQSQALGDDQDQGNDQREHKGKQLKKKCLELIMMMMVDPFNLNPKCHTQESIKAFNGIIPLTIYLGVFEEG